MNTSQMKKAVEDAGFQFLKEEDGWTLYDTDDRTEVPGVRQRTLGEAVWKAADVLQVDRGKVS